VEAVSSILCWRCVVVTEAGSYLRLIDLCITQLKAQGPSRTCNESKEEEEEVLAVFVLGIHGTGNVVFSSKDLVVLQMANPGPAKTI